ncbi:hypothetical protein O3S80_39265 [Streptomyces sp. Lzd4kr]|nr:hypothetical protein [Streptomyces sp. Lzd4kr]
MPEPHERLDEGMNQRRLELRMNWREVAQAADISYEALRAVRRGDYRPTELTARTIDNALQWAPGSVYAILEGGEPAPLREGAAAVRGREEPATGPSNSALERELELGARLMADAMKALKLSPAAAEEAWRRAREEIVRTHNAQPSLEAEESPETRNHRAG